MKKELNSFKSLTARLWALLIGLAIAFQAQASDGITINDNNISLQQALASVKQQANVYVMYENDMLNGLGNISLHLKDASLTSAMDAICNASGLSYEIKGQYVLVTRADKKNRHNKETISGRVIDDTGEPLAGVSVLLGGKGKGTVTDVDGYYSIKANPGDKLEFRYIGMFPSDMIVGNEKVINVEMVNDTQKLGEVEVVSTGYQSLPKERATGSFATISAEDIKKVPTANVVQRMEGQVPGMKISVLAGDKSFDYTNTLQSANSSTRTMGAADYDISIRGVNTLSGEKMPIIVVDGVISDFDISNLDPNNIENITILKDAAAASIWGSRAANGVIVVTTKKGQKGQRPQVSLSMNLTTQDKPDLKYLKRMTSAQALEYEKEIVDRGYFYATNPVDYYSAQTYYPEGSRLALDLKNGKISQSEYDSRISQLSEIDNFDQMSEYFIQRASSQQYNVSVNGGGDNSTYYYAVSYAKENPYLKGNGANRININLSNSWKLFNRATLSTTFTGSFFKYKNNAFSIKSLMTDGVAKMMPYNQFADEKGNGIDYDVFNPDWTATLSSAYKPWTYNYLQELSLNSNRQRTDNYSANLNLYIPIYWGISSNTTYALERSYTEAKIWYDPASYQMRNMMNYYTPAGATNNTLGIRNGGLNTQTSNNRNWTFRQQLNYDGVINGMHRINALAGVEMRQTYIEQGSSTIWGYNPESGIADTQIDMSYNQTYGCIAGYNTSFNGGGYPTSINRRRRYLSYYANAGYTLLDRYYLSGSVRYDDYNNFGLDRKYRAKPFYSFGAKWNLSRENFMENAQWVNNFALRATYGINGNISLDAYPFTKISLQDNYITGQPSAFISALANPQLRWEKTYTTNIGVDFSLLNYRLNGSIDFYTKRSRDLIYSFPFSSTIVGNINNSSMTRNVVGINSRGLDINLQGVVYKDNDWDVNIGANMSWNTNTVSDNPFFREDQYLTEINSSPTYIGMIGGYATDKMFAFRWAGLDENGQPLVYNKDGETVSATESISSIDDLVLVGHSTPTVYGGVNLNISWKNFSLYTLFTYQFGSHFILPTMDNYVTNNYSKWNLSADIADRWREPGDELHTNVPGFTSNYIAINRYKYADINVAKGDYLRWRQISLNYRIDNRLLSRIGINSADVSCSVSNLGLLWKANHAGIDPDYTGGLASINLPPKKSYTLSLNINF